jgi:hypothetical protein
VPKDDPERRVREQAWTGDAVLALWARRWILAERGGIDDPLFQAITGNQFLSSQGRPEVVEARIGEIFEARGLEAAFAHLDETLLPLVKKRLAREQQAFRSTLKK